MLLLGHGTQPAPYNFMVASKLFEPFFPYIDSMHIFERRRIKIGPVAPDPESVGAWQLSLLLGARSGVLRPLFRWLPQPPPVRSPSFVRNRTCLLPRLWPGKCAGGGRYRLKEAKSCVGRPRCASGASQPRLATGDMFARTSAVRRRHGSHIPWTLSCIPQTPSCNLHRASLLVHPSDSI